MSKYLSSELPRSAAQYLPRSSEQSILIAIFKGNDILVFYIKVTEDVCVYKVSGGSS